MSSVIIIICLGFHLFMTNCKYEIYVNETVTKKKEI